MELNTLHFEYRHVLGRNFFLSSQYVTTPILYNIHITRINIQYSKGIRRQKGCEESLWCIQQFEYLCTSHLFMREKMQHTRNKIT